MFFRAIRPDVSEWARHLGVEVGGVYVIYTHDLEICPAVWPGKEILTSAHKFRLVKKLPVDLSDTEVAAGLGMKVQPTPEDVEKSGVFLQLEKKSNLPFFIVTRKRAN